MELFLLTPALDRSRDWGMFTLWLEARLADEQQSQNSKPSPILDANASTDSPKVHAIDEHGVHVRIQV